MANSQRTLILLDGSFAVCKLPSDAAVPPWATEGNFLSITRTPGELSVVCQRSVIPEGIPRGPAWRCLGLAGQIEFSAVGVLAALVVPLAKEGMSVFAISTFDTDYLLLEEEDLGKGMDALQRHGYDIQSQ
ncbi:MAG TPA: ACT domain-containing protein [Gemmataceae bacterium]|nr:ACT domain-containing protein [Gemmataceae bacterium]